MFNRRQFLEKTGLASLAVLLQPAGNSTTAPSKGPLVISTWGPNQVANAAAYRILEGGGRALDAVETGVQVTEADPRDQSVGYGGLPDRDGKVTLDACIMDEKGNCGSVMFVEGIKHPVKLARAVMEKTPHVQLAGEGARLFALQQGFKIEELLTVESKKAWKDWLKRSSYDPMITDSLLRDMNRAPGQKNNHDTIGMLALDRAGNLSGACSTSGLAFKMRGRVGDSPIIGAGLYVDNEVGAATATGVGEEVVRICGAHTIVELMRQGRSPEQACKGALERLVRMRGEKVKTLQIAFIAVSKDGETGAFSMLPGFNYAVHSREGTRVIDGKALYR
jgi:N4-(beta-N-acetylglucosaminyl)-L-asparaginase